MTRVVVQVRCHDAGQKGRWEAAAAAQGLELSAWLRRALDEQAALDSALARQEEDRNEQAAARLVEAGVQGPVSRLFERRV